MYGNVWQDIFWYQPRLGGGEADFLRSFGLRLHLNKIFVRLYQTELHRILVFKIAKHLGGQHSNVGWSRVGWSLVTISLHFHATSHPERQRLKIYLRKAKNWNSTRDSKRNLEYLHLPQAARRWGVPSQHKVLLLQPWLLGAPPEHNLYRVVFFNWPPLKVLSVRLHSKSHQKKF